jgi:hypothetical protein
MLLDFCVPFAFNAHSALIMARLLGNSERMKINDISLLKKYEYIP